MMMDLQQMARRRKIWSPVHLGVRAAHREELLQLQS